VAWVTGGLEDRVVRNEEPALVWVGLSPRRSGRSHLGEFVGDGSLVDAVGDAGPELAEGLNGQERAGLVPDLDDVDERHLVIETERSVAHAVGPGAVQFGVDRLDEFGVGVGLAGLGPDEALVHGYPLISGGRGRSLSPVQTPARPKAER
jgi:hypothetical protein